MKEQQIISKNKNSMKVGKNIEVLIEGILPDGIFFGRTYQDAPEVDGLAFVKAENELRLGEYYMTKIVEAKEYDIVCEALEE